MLIFQINQNELNKEINSKDWLFWNTYLQSRAEKDDYVLLPAFIDYIQDTNNAPIDNGAVLVELENNDDDGINT